MRSDIAQFWKELPPEGPGPQTKLYGRLPIFVNQRKTGRALERLAVSRQR
jgi:hypothetical protein